MAIGEIALRYALEEMRDGAREVGGNNQGPWVEKYLNAQHPERTSHRGEPWCAAFWSWCWLQAAHETGVQLPVGYSRSCGVLRDQFHELGRLRWLSGDQRVISAGDAVFWDYTGDLHPDHVSMVYEVRDGVLFTIGGNEGDTDSGAPVAIKRRGHIGSLKHLHGFGLMPQELP